MYIHIHIYESKKGPKEQNNTLPLNGEHQKESKLVEKKEKLGSDISFLQAGNNRTGLKF